MVNCGNIRCKRCKTTAGHGPYWYSYQRGKNGILKKKYIGKERPTKGKAEPLPEEEAALAEFLNQALGEETEELAKWRDSERQRREDSENQTEDTAF